MRRLLAALVVAGLVGSPAVAASVDPTLLALDQRDVPKGYLFDKGNSLLLTRRQLRQVPDEESRLLVRSGFQAGYYARYLNSNPPRWRYVGSGAFVFSTSKGPRTYMPRLLKSGLANAGIRARRIGLGDEAHIYTSSSRAEGTTVVWRNGRVLAWVSCSEMENHETLARAQARKQQRRMAAALR